MKKIIAASALLSLAGTASYACTPEQMTNLSNSISEVVQEVVAMDDANLGKAMSIMRVAAVAEYHGEPLTQTCVRQTVTLDALTAFAESLKAERSAMLDQDLI